MTAWLMTYLVHSSILIGLVALVSRFLRDEWLPIEEALWRVAILGGVVTASLQVGLPVEPLGGTWALGTASADHALVATAPDLTPAVTASVLGSTNTLPSLPSVLIAAWMTGALLLTFSLGLAYFKLERRLRGRHLVVQGTLFNLLEGLLERSDTGFQVQLSTSGKIEIPLAKGWWRREICLPERVASELAQDQQETILAHELAHLQRHDPRWLTLLRLFETVFFFQPLNRFARRQIHELAEFQCDDWAVERTGRPLTMARCLTSVAEWNLRPGRGLPAPALTSRGQGLKRRVGRLLDRHYPLSHQPRPTWLLPGVALLLLLTALAVPGFSVAESGDEPLPDPPTPTSPEEVAKPDPPAAPEVNPVAPVPASAAVPPVAPIPTPAVEPVRPVRPVEGRWPDLEIQRRELELQLQKIERALRVEFRSVETEARRLERDLVRQMERVERIPLEQIEAIELELQRKVQLQEHQIERFESLHKELQETIERRMALQEAELRQLREERSRLQDERLDGSRDDRQDP